MEASVVQFVALIPQQQVVAQDLGVVDLVFQFHDVRAQFLDLVLHGFDAGADLGPALALLFAVGLLFDCVLGFLLFLGLAVIAVLQGSKVRVEGYLAVFKVQDRTAQGLHQVAVMRDQQQRAGVGRQRLGQAFAHINVQVVGRLVQEHQVGSLKGQLGKAQAGQFAAGEGGAILEHFLAPVAKAGQVAADFQFGKAGVLVPDGIDDPAGALGLLLGEDTRLGAAA